MCRLTDFVSELGLQACNPEVSIDDICINAKDINRRPGLQFAGYLDNFDRSRIQVVGYMEYTYLKSMAQELKVKKLKDLFWRSTMLCFLQRH